MRELQHVGQCGRPAEQRDHQRYEIQPVTAIFTTAGFVFVSYGGLLTFASIAEEVHKPGRTIPLGLILSLVAVTVCYTFAVLLKAGPSTAP